MLSDKNLSTGTTGFNKYVLTLWLPLSKSTGNEKLHLQLIFFFFFVAILWWQANLFSYLKISKHSLSNHGITKPIFYLVWAALGEQSTKYDMRSPEKIIFIFLFVFWGGGKGFKILTVTVSVSLVSWIIHKCMLLLMYDSWVRVIYHDFTLIKRVCLCFLV